MSMRALIGMVQAFETPGSLSACVHLVDQLLLRDVVRRDAAEEPASTTPGTTPSTRSEPCATAISGFSVITVSSIESGAGSVGRVGAARLAEHVVHLRETA